MPTRKSPPTDRRQGADRRKADKGPPRGRERRISVEPRKPDVQELEVSSSEWARLQEEAAPKKR